MMETKVKPSHCVIRTRRLLHQIAWSGLLTRNQVEAMSPVERQQLADQCRRIAALADPSPEGAKLKGGVLADLQARRRDE
jgi:hypothetical protein